MTRQERIYHVLQLKLNGSLSAEEAKELASFETVEPELTAAALAEVMASQLESGLYEHDPVDREQMHQSLRKILNIDRASEEDFRLGERRNYRLWLAAAMVTLLVSLGVYLNFQSNRFDTNYATNHAKTHIPTDYVRTILLPDSSLVVLQAGSTLHYSEPFGSNARQVELVGEAFFDVHAIKNGREKIPFVIYSGGIKTTVLGTSFNIKAYPDRSDVVVSVLSGKVKIEDETQVLAILTEDQQISYSQGKVEKIETLPLVEKTIEWAQADLEFKGETFEEIANLLARRFNVSIDFGNEALKSCVTIASFSGTETLENILEVLCTLRNSHYQYHAPTQIIISGEGC